MNRQLLCYFIMACTAGCIVDRPALPNFGAGSPEAVLRISPATQSSEMVADVQGELEVSYDPATAPDTFRYTITMCSRGPKPVACVVDIFIDGEMAKEHAIRLAPFGHDTRTGEIRRPAKSSQTFRLKILRVDVVNAEASEPEKPTAEAPRVMRIEVRAYCPCRRCCGRDARGITATGRDAYSRGVAADFSFLPAGTVCEISGYGKAIVDDTGGALRRSWRWHGTPGIEIRFWTHEEAKQWGVKYLPVQIGGDACLAPGAEAFLSSGGSSRRQRRYYLLGMRRRFLKRMNTVHRVESV